MTSLRQIDANRRNADKSTGPQTDEGKAVSARNAERHGLRSARLRIKGENSVELADFAGRLRTQLAPATELEHFLVERIVATAWRLRRVPSLEAALFRNDRLDVFETFLNSNQLGRAQDLSRYEVTLERSLYKGLHELQRMQAARRGEHVPLAQAVDVDVSISDG